MSTLGASPEGETNPAQTGANSRMALSVSDKVAVR